MEENLGDEARVVHAQKVDAAVKAGRNVSCSTMRRGHDVRESGEDNSA